MTDTRKRALVVGINYSPEPTGIAPYTAGLVDMLASADWDIKVITTVPHYPAWKVDPDGPPAGDHRSPNGAYIRRVLPNIPKRLSQIGRVRYEIAFGLRAAFKSWGTRDALVIVSPALFSSAIALAKSRITRPKMPVYVWVQDFYSLGVQETQAGGGLATRLITRLESWVLRHSDHVIAIHDRFARHAIHGLGVDSDRITVIRNWTHVRSVEVDRLAARDRFGWSDQLVVVHAGNMGAKQGLENVIDAARLADTEESHVVFVLLGGGNRREALGEVAIGVERIRFMDSLGDDDFVAALHAADVLLVNELPGVQEMAVPSKLTSYYSSGRPVLVASDPGSITSEEIETSGGGIRVNAGDPRALLDAAIALGANPALAEELGRHGRAFQREVLSPETAAEAFIELLGRNVRARHGRGD